MTAPSRVPTWRLLPLCVLAAACAARPTVPSETRASQGTVGCDRTSLSVVFISQVNEPQRAQVEASARRLNALLASQQFAEACSARAMNRTDGRSSAAVCHHVACAGQQDLKVGLFHDPDMPTLAFEKRGAVFLNAAKARAGTPSNLVHEFAHVLGYTHMTWWEWRREDSVPYALADVVEALEP